MLYDIEDVNISELKRVCIISAGENKVIKFRSYQIDKVDPYLVQKGIELKEVGPSLDLKVRRIKLGSSELYKLACKQPKVLRPHKVKNIETNVLGEKRGRVHVGRQDVNNMALKPYKRILQKKRKVNEVNEQKKKNKQQTGEVQEKKKKSKSDIDLDL